MTAHPDAGTECTARVRSTKRHLSTSLTSDDSADHMLGDLSVQLSALSIEEVKIDHRLLSKPLNH